MADDDSTITPEPVQVAESGDPVRVTDLGDAGKKALTEERNARKAAEKERDAHAAKLKGYDDRDKSETQRLTEERDALKAERDSSRVDSTRLRLGLPGTLTGKRETIVTSIVQARPLHLLVLPTDSWLPLLAGLGTAGFFLLLTVKWMVLSALFGVAGLAAMLAWLWQSDRAAGIDTARVAEHCSLPIGATGMRSHAWWATVVLVVVDASIFAAFAFAHLHVSMLASVCPPPGAHLPADSWVYTSIALTIASAALMAWLGRRGVGSGVAGSRLGFAAWLVVATALATAAWATGWAAHDSAGLAPRSNAWSATIAAMLAWQGFHIVVLGVMSAYLVARHWSGLLTAGQRGTLDNVVLFWQYTLAQGVVALALAQWLPALLD